MKKILITLFINLFLICSIGALINLQMVHRYTFRWVTETILKNNFTAAKNMTGISNGTNMFLWGGNQPSYLNAGFMTAISPGGQDSWNQITSPTFGFCDYQRYYEIAIGSSEVYFFFRS